MTITTDRKVLLFVSAGLIAFVMSGAFLGRAVAVEGTYGYLRLFNEALYLVVNNYVQPVQIDALMEGAYRGLLESLDPDNEYLSPEAYERAARGESAGPADVGVTLSKRRGYAALVAVAPGGPAAEAGLKSGDLLISIDGRATRTMGVWAAGQALRGRPGTRVSVSVASSDRPSREGVTLVRKPMPAPVPTGSLLGADVGSVRVAGIREGDAKRLDQVITALKVRGADRLLLDLRGCASEALPEAIGMASLFIDRGTVVTVADRYEGDKAFRADGRRIAWTGPLGVLVDEGTARTCEVLAAALRDARGAAVVGEKTWGSGTLQRLVPLPQGDGLILAVGKYLSPAGKEWNGKGLEPDFAIEGEPGEAGDPQRQKAADYLRGLARPTASRPAA